MQNRSSDMRASQLSGFLRDCRGALIGVAVVSAIINILFLTGPLFMLEVYDRVLPSRSVPTLLALLAIVAVLYACQGLLDLFRSRLLARIGALLHASISRSTFGAVVGASLRNRHGEQALQPIRDVDQIRVFLGGACPGALFDLPWIPLYMLVCFAFHFWIGMLALGGAAILLFLTLLTDLASRRPAQQATTHAAVRGDIAEASRRNAEVARALGMERRLSDRWDVVNSALVSAQLRLSDIAAAFGALSRFFRMLLQSGVLALGALLVIEGDVSGGVIVASSILVSRALAPVELSIAHWRSFIYTRQSWKRLNAMLTAERAAGVAMALPRPAKTLSVSNLAVAPPGSERVVVRGVDFTLEAGAAVAIVGPSAAGKSSLARTLVGLWPAVCGTVRLDGAELRQWDSEALGPHIGYLPQDVELFSGTVAENISRFDPDARAEDIIAAARAADVHDMILRLTGGYQTEICESGSILSTGQRQRIGLARALYGEPFLVVLDEPNSNLDSDGEAALSRAILGIRARKGIAIVVAHRASALSACTLVMMVAGGSAQLLGAKESVVRTIPPHPASPDLAVFRGGILATQVAAGSAVQGASEAAE